MVEYHSQRDTLIICLVVSTGPLMPEYRYQDCPGVTLRADIIPVTITVDIF